MAEDAVFSELLSEGGSRYQGKIQGISSILIPTGSKKRCLYPRYV
jgi:hypothetical protein